MNSNQTWKKVWGAVFSLSLLLGIAIISSTTAQAQYRRDGDYRQDRRDRDRDYRDRDNRRDRRDDRYGRNGDYNNGRYGNNGGYGNNGRYGGYGNNGYNVYQIAQQNGYQAGLNTGASDAQRRQSYSPQRSHYYQNATNGYNSSYGNREGYKQAYRNGFVQGYNQGYRQYDGNGGYGRNYPNNRNRTGSILGDIFGRP
ncbi:MAG: hypothetical protein WCB68_04060 [Pyrinomonadaceae bacterium]